MLEFSIKLVGAISTPLFSIYGLNTKIRAKQKTYS